MTAAADPLSKAFMEAYEEYADAIYRHCFYRTSQKEIAEDLMQDTFMRVWDYLKEGKKVENMRAFLYHIAHNLIVNYYKKKKHVSLDQLQEEGFDLPSADQGGMDAFSPAVIAQYLSALEPDMRELLILRYVDEMGPAEIAAVTGLSPNVVSVRLHRGIQKLRTLLGDEQI